MQTFDEWLKEKECNGYDRPPRDALYLMNIVWNHQQRKIDYLKHDMVEMTLLVKRLALHEEPKDIDKLWEELGLNEDKK